MQFSTLNMDFINIRCQLISFSFLVVSGFCTLNANCQTSKFSVESLKYYHILDSLIEHKYFFAARDLYRIQGNKLSSFHMLKVEADLDNVFNKPEESNKKIDLLFKDYQTQLTDSVKYYLLDVKQNNHAKLFEYDLAYQAANEILTKYSNLLDEFDRKDYANTRKIWADLSGQPKQTIIIKGNTDMKMEKDKAGLSNLLVTQDGNSIGFIFDTGANFSTVTESTARRLKMYIKDSLIEVSSITGEKVNARMAVCPEFNIGNIYVSNAVFLVFPDKELEIPQLDFQINGIIGFPVIEAMKEIQITKNGEFIVPQVRTTHHIQNLAINFLTPVIDIGGESYSFDSGADETILYDVYYKKYKNELDSKYKESDIQIGGAGGSISKKGYKVTFERQIENKHIKLNDVLLFKANIKEDENYYYGNIGQDVIKSFDKMTINFESMFIKFE